MEAVAQEPPHKWIATVLFGIVIALLGILRMLSLMPVGLGDVLRANLQDMGLGGKD